MNHEFTAAEIKDAIRAARIFCPGFAEEQFKSLIDLESRIADSGYLDTVRGVHRLEMEHNLPVTSLLDTYEELMKRNKEMEGQMNESESSLARLAGMIKQEQQKQSQLQEEIREAEIALAATEAKCEQNEKKLKAFHKREDAEIRRIEKGLEDCRLEANITREEVITAGQIKAEVEKHGFSLELVLGLSREFAGYDNAKETLASALKKHDTLTGCLKEMEERGEEQQKTLLSEISLLETQNKQLKNDHVRLDTIVSQLKSEEAAEQGMRQFYQRFHGLGEVLEQLAKWKTVYPLRCNNPVYALAKPFNPSAGCARIWTDKPISAKCPYCGMKTLAYDEEVYNALGLPVGGPIKIVVGV